MSKKEIGTIDIQIEISEDTSSIAKRDISIKKVSGALFLVVMFETIMDVVVDQNLDTELVEIVFRLALESATERQKENKQDQYDA